MTAAASAAGGAAAAAAATAATATVLAWVVVVVVAVAVPVVVPGVVCAPKMAPCWCSSRARPAGNICRCIWGRDSEGSTTWPIIERSWVPVKSCVKHGKPEMAVNVQTAANTSFSSEPPLKWKDVRNERPKTPRFFTLVGKEAKRPQTPSFDHTGGKKIEKKTAFSVQNPQKGVIVARKQCFEFLGISLPKFLQIEGQNPEDLGQTPTCDMHHALWQAYAISELSLQETYSCFVCDFWYDWGSGLHKDFNKKCWHRCREAYISTQHTPVMWNVLGFEGSVLLIVLMIEAHPSKHTSVLFVLTLRGEKIALFLLSLWTLNVREIIENVFCWWIPSAWSPLGKAQLVACSHTYPGLILVWKISPSCGSTSQLGSAAPSDIGPVLHAPPQGGQCETLWVEESATIPCGCRECVAFAVEWVPK